MVLLDDRYFRGPRGPTDADRHHKQQEAVEPIDKVAWSGDQRGIEEMKKSGIVVRYRYANQEGPYAFFWSRFLSCLSASPVRCTCAATDARPRGERAARRYRPGLRDRRRPAVGQRRALTRERSRTSSSTTRRWPTARTGSGSGNNGVVSLPSTSTATAFLFDGRGRLRATPAPTAAATRKTTPATGSTSTAPGPNPKTDFKHIMAHARNVVGDSAFAYLGAERLVNNGTMVVDFELNQKPFKAVPGRAAQARTAPTATC